MSSTTETPNGTAKKLDVIIIGGGVCGLVCAIALAKRGLYAHVYEAAAKFGEIGAGIGIGYNAIRILRSIGVFEDIVKEAGEDPASLSRMFQFISGMGGHELMYDYPEDPEGGHFGIARSVFLDALVHHVDHQYTHFHKHCTSVSQPPPGSHSRPAAHFSDGTSVEADVILLADGIHGAGREAVTGRDPKEDVVFSNYVCYRGLVPSEDLHKAGVKTDLAKRPVCFTGVDKHLIVFPIRGDKVVNIVAFVMDRSVKVGSIRLPEGQPAVVSVTKEELLNDYEGWGSDVVGLLSCIEHPTKWYINVIHPPLKTYAKGSIALLGDAAHGMTPHLGSGAGTGIEDAYLLSQLLTHPQTTIDNIQNVLEVYSTIRRPRAQSVWDGSMRAGDIYEGYGEHGRAKEGMAQDLANLWSFVWSHDAEADYAKALKLLQEAAVFSAQ